MRELLGTGQLPNKIVRALLDRFRVTWEDCGGLSLEPCSGKGLCALLGHLTYRVGWSPVSGLELLVLLGVGPYSMDPRLLAFIGELPPDPPVTEIPVNTFAVRRAIRTEPQADHHVHVEGYPMTCCQSMSCEMTGNIQEDAQDLAFWGMTFFPPGSDSCLLGQGANITEASCLPPPLIASKLPTYDKVLDWIQFYYTGDWTGDYVALTLTDFEFSTLTYGELLFAPALRRL